MKYVNGRYIPEDSKRYTWEIDYDDGGYKVYDFGLEVGPNEIVYLLNRLSEVLKWEKEKNND